MLRALHGQLGAAQRMAGAGPPAGAGWEPNLTGDAVSLGGLRETLGAGLGLPGGVQPEADLAGAAAQPGDTEREAGAGAHDVPDPDPAAAPGAARERAWQEERDVRVLELLRSKARARQRCRDPLGHAPGCAMAAALGRRDATRHQELGNPGGGILAAGCVQREAASPALAPILTAAAPARAAGARCGEPPRA